MDNDISNLLSLGIYFVFLVFAIAVKAPTNAKKPPANIAPFSRSSLFNFEVSLHTPTIIAMATAIPVRVDVIAGSCIADFPMEITLNAPIKISMAPIILTSPINPCLACSGLISPMSFTVSASKRIAAPRVSNPVFTPATLRPSLPIVAEAACIFVIALARRVSTIERTTMTPTDLYRFVSSTMLRTTTAPARIAIEVATFLSPSAAVSNALAFRTFEILFSIPANPSITSLTLPIPSTIAFVKS